MSPGDAILLRLDALECLGVEAFARPASPAPARRRPRVEPNLLAHLGGSDFGMVLGQQSVADLIDLMTLWAYRMKALDTWYGAASPVWVQKDTPAFIAFTNDRDGLVKRYEAAVNAANGAVTMAKVNFTTPNSMIPAQAEYDGLTKAMRQCAPPDGCPVVAGDWADLYDRAIKVSASLGVPLPVDAPPQPTATDVDTQILQTTQPVQQVADAVAPVLSSAATGSMSTLAWIAKHKTILLVGGAVVVGGIVFLEVLPFLKLLAAPAKVAKLAAVAAA